MPPLLSSAASGGSSGSSIPASAAPSRVVTSKPPVRPQSATSVRYSSERHGRGSRPTRRQNGRWAGRRGIGGTQVPRKMAIRQRSTPTTAKAISRTTTSTGSPMSSADPNAMPMAVATRARKKPACRRSMTRWTIAPQPRSQALASRGAGVRWTSCPAAALEPPSASAWRGSVTAVVGVMEEP